MLDETDKEILTRTLHMLQQLGTRDLSKVDVKRNVEDILKKINTPEDLLFLQELLLDYSGAPIEYLVSLNIDLSLLPASIVNMINTSNSPEKIAKIYMMINELKRTAGKLLAADQVEGLQRSVFGRLDVIEREIVPNIRKQLHLQHAPSTRSTPSNPLLDGVRNVSDVVIDLLERSKGKGDVKISTTKVDKTTLQKRTESLTLLQRLQGFVSRLSENSSEKKMPTTKNPKVASFNEEILEDKELVDSLNDELDKFLSGHNKQDLEQSQFEVPDIAAKSIVRKQRGSTILSQFKSYLPKSPFFTKKYPTTTEQENALRQQAKRKTEKSPKEAHDALVKAQRKIEWLPNDEISQAKSTLSPLQFSTRSDHYAQVRAADTREELTFARLKFPKPRSLDSVLKAFKEGGINKIKLIFIKKQKTSEEMVEAENSKKAKAIQIQMQKDLRLNIDAINELIATAKDTAKKNATEVIATIKASKDSSSISSAERALASYLQEVKENVIKFLNTHDSDNPKIIKAKLAAAASFMDCSQEFADKVSKVAAKRQKKIAIKESREQKIYIDGEFQPRNCDAIFQKIISDLNDSVADHFWVGKNQSIEFTYNRIDGNKVSIRAKIVDDVGKGSPARLQSRGQELPLLEIKGNLVFFTTHDVISEHVKEKFGEEPVRILKEAQEKLFQTMINATKGSVRFENKEAIDEYSHKLLSMLHTEGQPQKSSTFKFKLGKEVESKYKSIEGGGRDLQSLKRMFHEHNKIVKKSMEEGLLSAIPGLFRRKGKGK